jgi:hypothetical protein
LKRKAATPSELLDAAKRIRNDLIQKGKLEFMPYASSWLNGERWKDEGLLPLEDNSINKWTGEKIHNPFPHIPLPRIEIP